MDDNSFPATISVGLSGKTAAVGVRASKAKLGGAITKAGLPPPPPELPPEPPPPEPPPPPPPEEPPPELLLEPPELELPEPVAGVAVGVGVGLGDSPLSIIGKYEKPGVTAL